MGSINTIRNKKERAKHQKKNGKRKWKMENGKDIDIERRGGELTHLCSCGKSQLKGEQPVTSQLD